MPKIHGTPSGYANGCGCTECKLAAKRARAEGTHDAYLSGRTKVKPLWVEGDRTTPFDPEDPRHGGLTAYTMGCRCTWCLAAGKASRLYKKMGDKLPRGWNARKEGLE